MAPPSLPALTRNYVFQLYVRLPKPVRDAAHLLFSHVRALLLYLVDKIHRSALLAALVGRVPPKMRRPLSVASALAVLFLLFGLPAILAQGPPFQCLPFPGNDYRSHTFRQLRPFCCKGELDGQLKIGTECIEANGGKFKTRSGDDLHTCHEKRRPACCAKIVQLRETKKFMRNKFWSYCDQDFLSRPDELSVIKASEYGRPK